MGLAEVVVNFTADYMDYTAEWARRLVGEILPSGNRGENIFYVPSNDCHARFFALASRGVLTSDRWRRGVSLFSCLSA